MRKRIVSCLLAASLASVTAAQAAPAVKIGTIDLQRAVTESKEGTAERENLLRKTDGMKANLQVLVTEMEKLKANLEKEGDKLSADDRTEKGRELQKKAREFQDRQREAQEEIKQYENDRLKRLLAKFAALLNTIGKEESYDLILDKNAGVFYVGTRTDITPLLVKKADEEYRKD